MFLLHDHLYTPSYAYLQDGKSEHPQVNTALKKTAGDNRESYRRITSVVNKWLHQAGNRVLP